MEELEAMVTFFFPFWFKGEEREEEKAWTAVFIFTTTGKKTPAALLASVSGPGCQTEQGFHLCYTRMPMLYTSCRV